MSWLAVIALPLLLWALGAQALRAAGGRPARAAPAIVAGALAFYLALSLLTWLGVPWTRWTLAGALAILFALARWASAKRGDSRGTARGEAGEAETAKLGWGDAAAGALVVAFALFAVTLWVTTPDFVYHWGFKAERFALAGAIDLRFLARPWNGGPGIHPDYPNLLPSLDAATAIFAGRFDPGALMLWSAVWFTAILAALRDALRAAGVERWTAQAAIAAVAAVMATFALGNSLAGGADWLLALALAVAVPALCGAADDAADLQVGIAAAFAAASKIEGVPLAVFLVAVHLARRSLPMLPMQPTPAALAGGGAAALTPRALGRAALVSGLPPAAAIVPWAIEAARHGLFQAGNSGPFDWARRGEIWRGVRDVASSAPLHGLPWGLALLPLLALSRRTRPLAAVVAAQALFFAWAYLASSIDPWLYVLSNGSRLAFQLLPAVLVGAVLATEPAIELSAPTAAR